MLVLLGLLAAGCTQSGGQTGEGDGLIPSCQDAQAVSVGVDDRSRLGFAMSEVLSFVTKPRDFPATWPATVTTSGVAASAEGHLTVAPLGDGVRFIDSKLSRAISDQNPCRGHYEMDVHVELELTSDTDVLDFGADGLLTADSRFVGNLDAEALPQYVTGDPKVPLGGQAQPGNYRLDAQLTAEASAGLLQREIATAADKIASWPGGDCLDHLPVATEGALFSVIPTDVLARFSGQRPLIWQNGQATTVNVTLEAISASACLMNEVPEWPNLIDYPLVVPEDVSWLQLPARLSVTTGDSQLTASFDTKVLIEVDKRSGLRRAWTNPVTEYTSGAELTAATGLFNSSIDAAAPAKLRFELLLSGSDAAKPIGELTVMAQGLASDCGGYPSTCSSAMLWQPVLTATVGQ